MSTETVTRTAPDAGRASVGGLSFAGLFRSEWIKFWSLRSTWWCLVIAVALVVGLGVLFGASANSFVQLGVGEDPTALLVTGATSGTGFSMLVIAVLGSLVVTGEYATGMIRTSFLAAPTRWETLGVKALLLGLVAFVVGLASCAIAALVSYPMFAAADLDADLGSAGLWFAILGAAGSLALVAVIAVGFGTLVRSSALAITISVAMLFVLPIVFSILTSVIRAEWFQHVNDYLPSSLATSMQTYTPSGAGADAAAATGLDPWQGTLVLALWAAAAFGAGLLAARSRDA